MSDICKPCDVLGLDRDIGLKTYTRRKRMRQQGPKGKSDNNITNWCQRNNELEDREVVEGNKKFFEGEGMQEGHGK